MTTGIATRNSDSGSGGDKKAPSRNAQNQICLRYDLTVERRTTSNLSTKSVTSGAWNPTADASAKFAMKDV